MSVVAPDTSSTPPQVAARPFVGASWADARLLAYVAAVDLVFVSGVLVPYLTRADRPTTGIPAWLGWPALLCLLVLPLVTVAAGAVAVSRLRAAGGRRRLAVGTLLLAVAGLATYVSPVGVASVRWFLD